MSHQFEPAPELLPRLAGGKSPGVRLSAFRDCKDNLFVYKAHPFDLFQENRTHRIFVDVAAYEIGRLMGLRTAVPVRPGRIGQTVGSLMDYIPYVSRIWDRMRPCPSTRSVDLSNLTPGQATALVQEQVLDWITSNHDPHGGHFLITKDDAIHAIDKSQAFKYFPNDALSIDYNPNAAANGRDNFAYWPVYPVLLCSIRNGSAPISFSDAWEAVDAVLSRVEGVADDDFRNRLGAYSDYRFNVVDNPNENLTAEQFMDLVMDRRANARRDFEAFYATLETPYRPGGGGGRKSRRQAESEAICQDFERIETLLRERGSEQNFEAARMMVPVAAKLRKFLMDQGVDEFLNVIEQGYFKYRDTTVKEIIASLMSESANDLLARKEVLLGKAHCPFFAKIALRHIKRVILRILEEIRRTPAGQVLLYQNLRMGGLYPPMEKGMKDLFAGKGYPVMEIDLDNEIAASMSPNEICKRMQALRRRDDFQRAKIVMTRFKVSSAPNPEDSQHPESHRSLPSQRDKFIALYALADVTMDPGHNVSQRLPILMTDASKNRFSLAQEQVRNSCIQVFNALDLMSIPFYYHHLYWQSAYGMDNVEDLMPASGPEFENGRLYASYAAEVVRLVENDAACWKG